MRISDWSSDVCSSDLFGQMADISRFADMQRDDFGLHRHAEPGQHRRPASPRLGVECRKRHTLSPDGCRLGDQFAHRRPRAVPPAIAFARADHLGKGQRSEEHTSELQSLMRISYAVLCLKKKKK